MTSSEKPPTAFATHPVQFLSLLFPPRRNDRVARGDVWGCAVRAAFSRVIQFKDLNAMLFVNTTTLTRISPCIVRPCSFRKF